MIGQNTLGSAAIFGLFLGAGSLIHCGKNYWIRKMDKSCLSSYQYMSFFAHYASKSCLICVAISGRFLSIKHSKIRRNCKRIIQVFFVLYWLDYPVRLESVKWNLLYIYTWYVHGISYIVYICAINLHCVHIDNAIWFTLCHKWCFFQAIWKLLYMH